MAYPGCPDLHCVYDILCISALSRMDCKRHAKLLCIFEKLHEAGHRVRHLRTCEVCRTHACAQKFPCGVQHASVLLLTVMPHGTHDKPIFYAKILFASLKSLNCRLYHALAAHPLILRKQRCKTDFRVYDIFPVHALKHIIGGSLKPLFILNALPRQIKLLQILCETRAVIRHAKLCLLHRPAKPSLDKFTA